MKTVLCHQHNLQYWNLLNCKRDQLYRYWTNLVQTLGYTNFSINSVTQIFIDFDSFSPIRYIRYTNFNDKGETLNEKSLPIKSVSSMQSKAFDESIGGV